MSAEHLTLQVAPASPLEGALDAFLLDREAARCTPKTLEHYRYTVGTFVAGLVAQGVTDVDQITPHHVRRYLVSLQHRGLKDTTQHAHARGIKAWLNWLVREGDLERSPMRQVAMPRLDRRIPPPFTPAEVRRLLGACPRRSVRGARNYALVLALLDTGLRAAEICSLRLRDLDLRSGLVTVLGKGRKQRTVRIGARARAAIVRMLGHQAQAGADAPLWVAYDLQGLPAGALSVHGLQTMLVRLGRAADVHPCGPHRFRRTFALWCLRDGMDLHSLRMLMGHSSLAVLQRYLDLAGEDVERAHRAHSPADRLLGP